MRKLAGLVVVALAVAASPGCQLCGVCLVPCYSCLAFSPQALRADAPLPEVAPVIAATAGDQAQLPAR